MPDKDYYRKKRAEEARRLAGYLNKWFPVGSGDRQARGDGQNANK